MDAAPNARPEPHVQGKIVSEDDETESSSIGKSFARESAMEEPVDSQARQDANQMDSCSGIAAPHSEASDQPPSLDSDRAKPWKTLCKMHKYSLYETTSRYYLVGTDVMDQKFRVLKIDRTAESGELSIADDDIVYSKAELHELLNAIDDGNRNSGGLKLRMSTWGLLGFIRFTGEHYMLLVTKRSSVAMVGGHYLYQIDGTELVSLSSPVARSKADRHPEEARFVGILNNLDLTRSFYFSYSYDITNTLQHNIVRERELLRQPNQRSHSDLNEMFIWNHYLLQPACSALKNPYDWCIPIIHGFVDQASEFIAAESWTRG